MRQITPVPGMASGVGAAVGSTVMAPMSAE